MTETLYCAICGERTAPDVDHVRITAEHVLMDDRNREEMFVFHPECWQRLSEGWADPA